MNGCGVGHTVDTSTLSPESKVFYAVFIKASYHVEGDERSRTNPGHGYPAHDVEYTKVQEFMSKEALKQWIIETKEKNYKVVECRTMEVTKTINVDVTIK